MTERARVMLLLSSLNGGGAERVAVHLINRCDPDIVDVRIGLSEQHRSRFSPTPTLPASTSPRSLGSC